MEGGPTWVAEALREFFDDLALAGRSPETVTTYRYLLRFPAMPLSEFDRAYCRGWLAEQVRRRKPSGANTCSGALKSFGGWLAERGYALVDPTDGLRRPKVPEGPPKALPAPAMARLWQAAVELDLVGAPVNRRGECFTGLEGNLAAATVVDEDVRSVDFAASSADSLGIDLSHRPESTTEAATELDSEAAPKGGSRQIGHPESTTYRLIVLLLGTGLRRSELANARWQDIEGDTLRVVGKGRKVRRVLIPPEALALLNRPSGHPTILGLTSDKLYRRFKAIARRAGVQAHPHQLRHTFATDMLRKGMSPLALQTLGGWADMSMLKRYAKASLEEAALTEARRLQT